MQELNLSTGGHPLRIDDILHLQSGIIDALKGICEGLGLGNSTYFLSGCNVSVNILLAQQTVSPGYIYHNGKIYPLDTPVTVPLSLLPGQVAYWYIEQQVLSPSPVTYQDGNLRDVHIRERFNAAIGPSLPPGAIPFGQIRHLKQVMGIIPQQGIIMYSGPTTDFTSTGLGKFGTRADGWALCNGNTFSLIGGGNVTTPDLRGKFIIGYDPSAGPSYNNIGDTGSTNITVGSGSGAQYYALAYIMRLY